MARCDFCFREKPTLEPPIPKIPAKVCKACSYELDKAVGFFQHYGFVLMGQGSLLPEFGKPAKSKSRRKSAKVKTEPIPQVEEALDRR